MAGVVREWDLVLYWSSECQQLNLTLEIMNNYELLLPANSYLIIAVIIIISTYVLNSMLHENIYYL